MMAVTHGIVANSGNIVFAVEITTVAVGDEVIATFVGTIGEFVTYDAGDGVLQTQEILANGQATITADTVTTNVMRVTSTTPIIQPSFTGTDVIKGVNFIKSSTLTSLASLFSAGAADLTQLTDFAISDTSNVTLMQFMFANTGITSIPFMDTSNVTDIRVWVQSCASLVCITNVDSTLANASGNSSNMFFGTPLLTNPNAAEQTAIEAGSNYVNAGACG